MPSLPVPEALLPPAVRGGHALVLFDGVCTLCNGAVTFILDRDPAAYFLFAALQAEAVEPLLRALGLVVAEPDSIVLIEGGRCYRQSEAALRIARRLRGGWPLLYGLMALPRPLRDAVYAWIARHRYQWFGRRAACRVPTPAVQDRFL